MANRLLKVQRIKALSVAKLKSEINKTYNSIDGIKIKK